MKNSRNWLIIYDICEGKRLARVAKILTKYAVRVQHSIYEVKIEDYKIRIIRSQIQKEIDLEEDSVIWYDLCDTDWEKRKKIGPKGNLTADIEDFILL